ncbi:nucleotide exchange factor GrpE [Candidatus Parcubacteria bacterium]|nr:nucleotide exchange factor GrpE [Patescibacteria group bacterium]MCG2694394.1 nucleotide exchange factor GrpE [Candidatus Parcubacteria bacterium]
MPKKEEKSSFAKASDDKQNIKDEPQKRDELQEWKNLALRMKADYENREREIAKEKTALRGLVEENLICDFLPVLDNLNSALVQCAESNLAHNGSWVEGVNLVRKQFEDLLRQRGVEKMELLGTEFDPSLAEAVDRSFASSSAKATDGTGASDGNKVVKVIIDGYKKGERIIRPGRVIVGE